MKTLIAIQAELKAPKGQYNSFGKYHYRSCEDIFEALKPLLEKHGASVTIEDELILIGDRYYVKATATFCSISGYTRSVSAYAREEETKKGMDGSQITGASSSYARKYALNGLFLIDDTKDSDSTNEHDKGQDNNKTTQPAPTPQTLDELGKTLKTALEEVAKSKTVTELQSVWNKYTLLQKNESFKKEVTNKKKSL